MRYASPALILLASLVLHAPAAHAVPMTFVANLNSANENNPADMSTATGLARGRAHACARGVSIPEVLCGRIPS